MSATLATRCCLSKGLLRNNNIALVLLVFINSSCGCVGNKSRGDSKRPIRWMNTPLLQSASALVLMNSARFWFDGAFDWRSCGSINLKALMILLYWGDRLRLLLWWSCNNVMGEYSLRKDRVKWRSLAISLTIAFADQTTCQWGIKLIWLRTPVAHHHHPLESQSVANIIPDRWLHSLHHIWRTDGRGPTAAAGRPPRLVIRLINQIK